ncbi:hypothetical protein [Pedobacter sp. P26]|uniref:hypothetical protein n=1 Tax=Pedobacter sp. P26 TaxID=3423956 RepID=UPI003D674A9C
MKVGNFTNEYLYLPEILQVVLFKKMEEVISQGLFAPLNKLQPAGDRMNTVFHGRKYSGATVTRRTFALVSYCDGPYKTFKKR